MILRRGEPNLTAAPARARRSGTRWASGAACAIALGALALGLSGCAGTPGGTITTSAVFSDAGTLAIGAPVKLADVPVGDVSAITLEGSRAKVTMSIERRADVPANVIAKIDRTTILGERFVALVVPRHPAGRLADDAVIRRTAVVPTVEQVIGAGSEVFGAISASDLAEMVNAGGQGFSGEAAALQQFLNDTSAVAAGYASHTAQIKTVIQSLDRLGSSLAPTSGPDAQAITNLSSTVKVLAANSTRFEQLLSSLNAVSEQGASIVSSEYPQIVAQLRALEAVSNQLALHQQDLAQLLEWLPQHDATMSASVRHNFLQIMNNLVVCGLPGGGGTQTPSTSCAKR
ncbi:MAG TPA: MlaD family protein [Acidimicrobiales bacterium]|nr:MlaD family protein [Acidimicrobiales bacterium]